LVETREQFEMEDAERSSTKLADTGDVPAQFLDRRNNHPKYKRRAGDGHALVDRDQNNERGYAIDDSEQKTEYRKLGTH